MYCACVVKKQNAKSSSSEKSGAICLQLCKMQEKVPLFLLDRCRHGNIYGTEAGEAERDVYVPDTRESLQLNSNLDMDVTISSTGAWRKGSMRLRTGPGC